ncbi:MAG: hypothetical protein ABSC54_03050 [Smithellaceae bacterium]|jgi:hypothetical protein
MVKIIFDTDENWEKRTLCSDESCIGTISPDGKCKECGKTYEGKLPTGYGVSNIQKAVAEEKKPVSSEVTESDDDWNTRVLCSDGACIGVIGQDGKCKECGKRGSK